MSGYLYEEPRPVEGAEQFYVWARMVAGAINDRPWSATDRLLVWNEFKRIVDKGAFAR